MRRALTLAMAFLLVFVGGAYLLYAGLFSPAPVASQDAVARDGADVAAAARGDADAGTVVPSPGNKRSTRVTQVTGSVDKRFGSEPWRKVEVGEELQPDDAVRTGDNASAHLAVGDGITVTLSPRSTFRVKELTDELSRISLQRGHLNATVDEHGERHLRVETPGSDAVAESYGGQFGVATDGGGLLSVATTTGEVLLSAQNQSAVVGPGQTSSAEPGHGPSAPRKIPKYLLLKLAGVKKRQINRAHTIVEGRTDAGAVVRVGEALTHAGAGGRFRVRVPLQEGPNRVRVEVLDASGRRKRARLATIEVDRKKPEIEGEMEWGE